jgi:hypothetical protein
MRLSLLLVIFLAVACQENEADAPELLTKPAQQIGQTSAVLEAEVTETGPVKPIQIGFLWGTTNDLTIASAPGKHIIGATSSKGPFSINVGTFSPATTYYYRSFAANADFTRIYYGAIVSFTTLP